MTQTYRRGAAAWFELASGLDDAAAARPVPACRPWRVHDLLAHLSGASADFVAGRTEGVATPAWTARQVEAGRSRSRAELLAQWQNNVEAVAARCEVETPNPAWDVVIHLDDALEALGRPPGVAPERDTVTAAALTLLGRRGLTVSVAERERDPGSTTWHVATAYGLSRALFSRLDDSALHAEVIRGDVDPLRATAFFAR